MADVLFGLYKDLIAWDELIMGTLFSPFPHPQQTIYIYIWSLWTLCPTIVFLMLLYYIQAYSYSIINFNHHSFQFK